MMATELLMIKMKKEKRNQKHFNNQTKIKHENQKKNRKKERKNNKKNKQKPSKKHFNTKQIKSRFNFPIINLNCGLHLYFIQTYRDNELKKKNQN